MLVKSGSKRQRDRSEDDEDERSSVSSAKIVKHAQLDTEAADVFRIKQRHQAPDFAPRIDISDLTKSEQKYVGPFREVYKGLLHQIDKKHRADFERASFAVLCEHKIPDFMPASEVVSVCASIGIVGEKYQGHLDKVGKGLNKYTDMEKGFGKIIAKKCDIQDVIDLVEQLKEYTQSTLSRYLQHVLMPNEFPFVFIPNQYFFPLVHFTWTGLITISLPQVPTGQPTPAIQGVFAPLAIFGPQVLINYTGGGAAGWLPADLTYSMCPSFAEMTSWCLVSNEIVICDKSSELNKAGTITLGWSMANFNNPGLNVPGNLPTIQNGVVTVPGNGQGNKYYIGGYHYNVQADAQASAVAFPTQWNPQTKNYGQYTGNNNGTYGMNWGGWLGNSSQAEASLMHVLRVQNGDGAIRAVVPPFNPSDVEHVDGNYDQSKAQPLCYFFVDGSPGGIIDVRVTLNYQGVPQNQFRQKYGGTVETLQGGSSPDAISGAVNAVISTDKSLLRAPEKNNEAVSKSLSKAINTKVGKASDTVMEKVGDAVGGFFESKVLPFLEDKGTDILKTVGKGLLALI